MRQEGCLIIINNDSIIIDRLLVVFSGSHECHVAKTGKAGLALFRQLSDCKVLVISNLSLPDISGLEVCRSVKREDPQSGFIFLTDLNDSQSRMSGLLAKADNYIDKAVTDEELQLLVGNLYNTLNQEFMYDSEQVVMDDISDEIFCALEAEVRAMVEVYYQSTPEQRKGQVCTSKSIADRLGRSHRTFQREIKLDTGYSFKQLQLIVRLEKAQGLFAEGYNVNQVTDSLAFSSPAHLSRAFKEEFGITPSKYRSLM